jgi:hypothetical protein
MVELLNIQSKFPPFRSKSFSPSVKLPLIEQWASDIMFLDPSSEVGVRMVRKYLQIVDGFFPSDPHDISAVAKHKESLKYRSAPDQTPLGYWEHALAWQKTIDPQLVPGQATAAQIAEKEIAARRANIDLWKKQHGLSE